MATRILFIDSSIAHLRRPHYSGYLKVKYNKSGALVRTVDRSNTERVYHAYEWTSSSECRATLLMQDGERV